LQTDSLNKQGVQSLAEGVVRRDPRSLGRALSLVENGGREETYELIRALYPHSGRAIVVGVTGSPGTGKSTLTYELARKLRETGLTVGIIAVDPTSPFSGGAVLGDRIRMQGLAGDPGVFIRSMATRGLMGGLSPATADAVLVLDAAGFDRILIETVGVGQDEVDIARTAHLTAVLLVPGMGDDIQSIKAGVMEIADLFVINKSDLPGADKTRLEVESLLLMRSESLSEQIPIVKTVATTGEGIDRLLSTLEEMQSRMEGTRRMEEAEIQRARRRIMELLRERVIRAVLRGIPPEHFQELVEQVRRRSTDPVSGVEELLGRTQFKGIV